VLTNIAGGTSAQTQSIIDKADITVFVRLLKHENPDVFKTVLLILKEESILTLTLGGSVPWEYCCRRCWLERPDPQIKCNSSSHGHC